MESIRPADTADRDLLVAAYLEMLQWLDGQDYHILPTEQNAVTVVDDVFIPAIEERRSGIRIVEIEGQPAGFLFWVIESLPLQVRRLSATSYGQWVRPEFRGREIVSRMVYSVAANFRNLGVGQVLDMVHVPEAQPAASAAGFRANPKIVVLELF